MALLKVLSLVLFTACAFASHQAPLEVEKFVDIEKYQGRWYEIAKFPNSFQKQCAQTRATYSPKKNGKIKVFNECIKIKDGKLDSATGVARVTNPGENSKLKVTFVPWLGRIAEGDYQIMKLDVNYDYVLVGSPTRDYLWILARNKTLDQKIIDELLVVAKNQGFDISRMTKTPTWLND